MRYYKKMYTFILTISIFFVLFIEIVFLSNEIRSSSRQFEKFMADTTASLSGYTDLRLTSIAQSSMLLKVSEYTTQYIGGAPVANYVHLKLYQYISGIFGVAPAQQDAIAISKLSDDYVIMNSGTGDVKTLCARFYISQEQLSSVIEYFDKNVNVQWLILTGTNKDGQKQYTIIDREWLGYPQPLYLFVSFSEDKFFDLSNLSGGTFAIIGNNQVVASTGQYSPEQVQQMLDTDEYPRDIIHEVCSSSIAGYQYLYMAKKPGFLTASLILIIGAGLVVLACTFFFARAITSKLYLPIAELLNLTDDPITSGDDIAFIKMRILTLKSSVQSMSNSLAKYNRQLENKTFQDLLLNRLSPEQIALEPAFSDIRSFTGPFTASILRYNQLNKVASDLSQDMTYFLKQNIANTIISALTPYYGFYRIIDINFDTQVILLQCEDISLLKNLIEDILLKEESENELDFTAAIGHCCNSPEQLSASYRKAEQLLEMNEHLRIGAKVLTEADIPAADNRSTVYFPLSSEQRLTKALMNSKTAIWHDVIEDIITTNKNEREIEPQQLSLMFTAMLSRIFDTFRLNIDDTYNSSIVLYSEFRSCETFEQLQQKTKETLETLEHHIVSVQKPMNPSIKEKMIEFIEQNSHNDISLLDLADYLKLSRNYVSTLFKDATGDNFKDFLNKHRFEQACNIIDENPAIKLKDVAAQTGCSTDVFIRIFIRYGGMRPHEYQMQAMSKARY